MVKNCISCSLTGGDQQKKAPYFSKQAFGSKSLLRWDMKLKLRPLLRNTLFPISRSSYVSVRSRIRPNRKIHENRLFSSWCTLRRAHKLTLYERTLDGFKNIVQKAEHEYLSVWARNRCPKAAELLKSHFPSWNIAWTARLPLTNDFSPLPADTLVLTFALCVCTHGAFSYTTSRCVHLSKCVN